MRVRRSRRSPSPASISRRRVSRVSALEVAEVGVVRLPQRCGDPAVLRSSVRRSVCVECAVTTARLAFPRVCVWRRSSPCRGRSRARAPCSSAGGSLVACGARVRMVCSAMFASGEARRARQRQTPYRPPTGEHLAAPRRLDAPERALCTRHDILEHAEVRPFAPYDVFSRSARLNVCLTRRIHCTLHSIPTRAVSGVFQA